MSALVLSLVSVLVVVVFMIGYRFGKSSERSKIVSYMWACRITGIDVHRMSIAINKGAHDGWSEDVE